MAWYLGNDAQVFIGANEVGEVVRFSIDETAERITNDSVSGNPRRTKAGTKDAAGQIVCNYDYSDAEQDNLRAAYSNQTSVALVLRPVGTGSGLPQTSMTASITSKSRNPGPNEAIEQIFDYALESGTVDDTPQA